RKIAAPAGGRSWRLSRRQILRERPDLVSPCVPADEWVESDCHELIPARCRQVVLLQHLSKAPLLVGSCLLYRQAQVLHQLVNRHTVWIRHEAFGVLIQERAGESLPTRFLQPQGITRLLPG